MANNGDLYRTFETATEKEIRELYDEEVGDPLEDCIETHSGAWIKEGHVWRWWQANLE